jgi:hypothetical protein
MRLHPIAVAAVLFLGAGAACAGEPQPVYLGGHGDFAEATIYPNGRVYLNWQQINDDAVDGSPADKALARALRCADDIMACRPDR